MKNKSLLLLAVLSFGLILYEVNQDHQSFQKSAVEEDLSQEMSRIIEAMRPPQEHSGQEPIPAKVLSKEFDILDDRIRGRVAEVARLQQCYNLENCEDLQGLHPRDSHYEISMAMKWQLLQLKETLSRYPELRSYEIESFARAVLGFPEDHVREAGLGLIALFPTSTMNLESILNALEHSRSGDLYEMGLLVLNSYAEARYYEDHLLPFILRKIRTGGGQVSQTIANEVYPFINGQNYDDFVDVLRGLNKNSSRYRVLKAQLRQYRYLHPEES